MKSSSLKRKRFRKPFYFLVDRHMKIPDVLKEVFRTYHPEDFRIGLEKWQRLAIANDQSSYDEAHRREDLMDVVEWLKKLVDHFHIIHRNKALKKNVSKTKFKFHKKGKAEMPDSSSPYEQTDPFIFLNAFCNTFDPGYLEMELLDLLDAVITYKGVSKCYKGNLVFFYQHLFCLIKIAYRMNKIKSRKSH